MPCFGSGLKGAGLRRQAMVNEDVGLWLATQVHLSTDDIYTLCV
jgi:hypothetical protein